MGRIGRYPLLLEFAFVLVCQAVKRCCAAKLACICCFGNTEGIHLSGLCVLVLPIRGERCVGIVFVKFCDQPVLQSFANLANMRHPQGPNRGSGLG